MAGALWDLIAYVEIAIRNAMARELAGLRRKKSPRAAWFNNSEWFTSQQRAAIRKAKETTRAKGTTEGRVVAQLMFGFWASLLDPAHEHSLWVPGLRLAFPNSSGERKHVHGNVRSINDLRNDIAHHNRIFNRDIHKTEDRLLRTAYWVDARLADWLATRSRVREIAARRPVPPPTVRFAAE